MTESSSGARRYATWALRIFYGVVIGAVMFAISLLVQVLLAS